MTKQKTILTTNEDILARELSLNLIEQGFGLYSIIEFLYGGCFDEIMLNEVTKNDKIR